MGILEKLAQQKMAQARAAETPVKVEEREPEPPIVATVTEAASSIPSPTSAPASAPPKPLSSLERMRAKLAETKTAAPVPVPRPPSAQVRSSAPAQPTAQVSVQAAPQETPQDLSDPLLKEIKNNIAYLSSHIEEKSIVQQVIRTIMEQMRKNPHFRPFLTAADKETIVRGFRRAYNVAARKKVEAKDKKEKKSGNVKEIEQMMKNLGVEDIDFDLG